MTSRELKKAPQEEPRQQSSPQHSSPNQSARPSGGMLSTVQFRSRSYLKPTLRFRLKVWLADELAAFADEWQEGAKAYWVPIAFALGVVCYLALPREPVLGVSAALCVVFLGCAARLSHRPLMHTAMCALVLFTAGVTAAQIQSQRASAPVLSQPVTGTVTGLIERIDLRPNDRVRLRVHVTDFAANRATGPPPRRVEVSARMPNEGALSAAHMPPLGALVSFKARLFPPQGPILPGGYDFARARFLRGVGASGFVYGKVQVSEASASADQRFWPRAAELTERIDHVRRIIAHRLQDMLPAREAAIAIALTVGDRSLLSDETQETLRASGLAHILAISGLHMMLVSGTAFFACRLVLVLIPDLALRWPIKKIAAAIALFVAAAYLAISGASVATQRAFIMASVAFMAILWNKPAITMHSLVVAALIIMILDPAAVTGAGFQMSFCAVIALIAAYRQRRSGEKTPRPRRSAPFFTHSLASRSAGYIARAIAALALSSLIAGSATAPIAAYTFHRIAPFGLIANLLAMPMLSFWVMPLLLLLVVSMLLGLDPLLAPLIEPGLAWLMAVAAWVTSWSGHGYVGLQSLSLLIGSFLGLFLLCLTRTQLRYLGLIPIALGLALAPLTERPDLMISEDGRTVAVLEKTVESNAEKAAGSDPKLSFISAAIPDFLASIWLRAHGDDRPTSDNLTSDHRGCNETTCWYRAFPDSFQKQPTVDILTQIARLQQAGPKRVPDDQRLGGPNARQQVGRRQTRKLERPPCSLPWCAAWQIPIPPQGLLIATVKKPAGLTPACRLADIVVTNYALRYPCRSARLVADRRFLTQTGTLTGTIKAAPLATTTRAGAVTRTLHLKAAISPHPRPWTRWRHDAAF